MRRKEAGSSRTSMLRRARCAGHGEWRLDDRSSRSLLHTTSKQTSSWLQHTASRSPTAASASWPRCSTSGVPCPGRGARRRQQSASTECRPAGSGEPRAAGRVRPGPCLAGRLTCRGRPAPRPGQARPARAVASAGKYRPGGQYPLAAATLMARYSPQPPCCGDGGGFRITAIP